MKKLHTYLLLTTQCEVAAQWGLINQYEVPAQWSAWGSNPVFSQENYKTKKTKYQFSSTTQAYPTPEWSSLWNTGTLPGGNLYAGPGGNLYAGPGGNLYAGPGGPCYEGPGGPCHTGFSSFSMFGEPKEKPATCPKMCSQ